MGDHAVEAEPEIVSLAPLDRKGAPPTTQLPICRKTHAVVCINHGNAAVRQSDQHRISAQIDQWASINGGSTPGNLSAPFLDRSVGTVALHTIGIANPEAVAGIAGERKRARRRRQDVIDQVALTVKPVYAVTLSADPEPAASIGHHRRRFAKGPARPTAPDLNRRELQGAKPFTQDTDQHQTVGSKKRRRRAQILTGLVFGQAAHLPAVVSLADDDPDFAKRPDVATLVFDDTAKVDVGHDDLFGIAWSAHNPQPAISPNPQSPLSVANHIARLTVGHPLGVDLPGDCVDLEPPNAPITRHEHGACRGGNHLGATPDADGRICRPPAALVKHDG